MSLHINGFLCPQLKGAVTYRKTVYRTVLGLVAYPWDASIASYLISSSNSEKNNEYDFLPSDPLFQVIFIPWVFIIFIIKIEKILLLFFLSTLKSKVDFTSYKHVIDVINIYTHILHWIIISKIYRGFL